MGELEFEGRYAYVGSDQRGGRLARHATKGKKCKWHIDYLTEKAKVVGAWVMELGQEFETQLADHLAGLYPVVGGFGSSDCPDRGHLFLVDDKLEERVRGWGEHKGVRPLWWGQNSKNLPA